MQEDSRNKYVISGGEEGKNRLNVLAGAMQPYTSALLQTAGITEAKTFLDNGCGGANVAIMVAKMLGPEAKIVATDIDEKILALAAEEAEQQNLHNISFLKMPAYELAYHHYFDIAYARFLLSHLNDPLSALLKMKDSVKAGGKIIIEDIHFSGHFCYPKNRAFDKYLELYTEVVKHHGGNAEIGPELPALFDAAGIKSASFDVVQPCFKTGDGKWMAYITLKRISHALVKENMITEAELDDLLRELEAFTEAANTIISLPRIFRIWADL